MDESACHLVDNRLKMETSPQVHSSQDQENNVQQPEVQQDTKPRSADPECCKQENCLLRDTPRVGVFPLDPKRLEDSLLGRCETGLKFKFGKGKVTQGNVKAARNLLTREFPQVKKRVTSC